MVDIQYFYEKKTMGLQIIYVKFDILQKLWIFNFRYQGNIKDGAY